MNQWILRIAVVMIALFTGLGSIGTMQSPVFQPPGRTMEQVAHLISGSLLSRMHLEIAGAQSRETVAGALLSYKSQAPAVQAASDGTSPADPANSKLPKTQTKTGTGTALLNKPEGQTTPNKVALIYHSHNRESWLPELKNSGKIRANEAFDAKVNVSLLGERMRKKLEEDGVGAIHSKQDYQTAISSFNYNYSYKYSLTTVREAMAVHSDLTYMFDLHRDSQRREYTTVTIDGQDYAKLYFIIGEGNPHWEQNKAFAEQIHEELERQYPGVSKGILSKGTKHGNGEYNQSVSPSSVLIEIGGVDNTLEESYRTIDVLSELLAELIRKSEIAAAPSDQEAGPKQPV